MQSRIVALRHVECDKQNPDDPQAPTPGGEIAAFATGMDLRPFDFHFVECTSSPQPRAIYTARLILSGFRGFDDTISVPEITTDNRLNDFSTDERPVIVLGLEASKNVAKLHGLKPEQAIFLTPRGKEALTIKVQEMLTVIDELAAREGDHLLAGLHGAAIDGAMIALLTRLKGQEVPEGMGAHGGMFDNVEGFIAYFENGAITMIEQIRKPNYLKTLATVLK